MCRVRGEIDWCYWMVVPSQVGDGAKALTVIHKHWDLTLLTEGFK